MSSRAQGLRTWLLQRLSAVYMAIYIVIAFSWVCLNKPIDFPTWQSLFASLSINIASQIFIYMLLVHAWIGMRDIFIDYVHNTSVRFILITTMSLLQMILAIWVFMAFFAVVKL